ncbi:hypothetical protein LINPERHAP1_LOCUS18999 [Linum perenne]
MLRRRSPFLLLLRRRLGRGDRHRLRRAISLFIRPHEYFQIDALDLARRLLGKILRRDDILLQIMLFGRSLQTE